ncbi:MAG: recombination mediator RecR [Patescibacteria group bacterium]|jgi:recombination protein RecR
MYSSSINKLILALKKLPSVGERTAERYVFHWLKSGKKEVTELILSLKDLIDKIKSCEICWDFSDQSPCPICSDLKRDRSTVCVVTESQDLLVVEQTGIFKGVYHCLRELLDAGDEESLTRLKASELFDRINGKTGFNKKIPIKEIILALNPDLPGETTMMYLEKEIKKMQPKIKITRLARGLPLGADLRYADEITLGSAINNRTSK